jgi:hypothetical protein
MPNRKILQMTEITKEKWPYHLYIMFAAGLQLVNLRGVKDLFLFGGYVGIIRI